MKTIFTSIALFCALAVSAQPVLNGTSQIGYVAPIQTASAATAATVPIATVGANANWNCANLLPESGIPVVNFTVSTPVGTMYASDYPSANWYFTDPALVAVIGHHYYQLTTDSFMLWGAHTTGSAYEIYDNPEMDVRFPFAYSQVDSNSYSKTNYNAGGGVSSYQTGMVTVIYEGYGTLVLPNGTYNNVIKVKKIRTNSLGPTLNSYTWYNSANGEKLLMYEEKAGGSINVVYNTNLVSSVKDVAENQLGLYTFPGSKMVSISSNEMMSALQVYSLSGQAVYQCDMNSKQITRNFDLPAGMYILKVKTGETYSTAKMMLY